MNIFNDHIRYRWYTIHKELFFITDLTHCITYTAFMSDTVVLNVKNNPLYITIKRMEKYVI